MGVRLGPAIDDDVPSADGPKPPVRLLFIDDDPDYQSLLRLLVDELDETPFEALFVSSAQDAMRVLDTTWADVIVSDFRLPDGRGHEILRDGRRADEASRRIILTSDPDVAEAAAAKDYEVWSKDLDVDDLARRLRSLVGAPEPADPIGPT